MDQDGIVKDVKIHDTILKCPICHNNEFQTRYSLMNTAGMSFMDLDWLNKESQNFICTKCGYIFWFFEKSYSTVNEKKGDRPQPFKGLSNKISK